jgi:hypothetical protein
MTKKEVGLTDGIIQHMADVFFDLNYDEVILDWNTIKRQVLELMYRLQRQTNENGDDYFQYQNIIDQIEEEEIKGY